MAGTKPGSWCHIEIPTAQSENAKRFYGNCFGWSFQDVPALNYTIYRTGDGEVGGGLWNPAAGIPRAIVCYINVERIEEAVAKVEAQGGKLVNPKMEVPNAGWFALIADPDQNVIGLWQSLTPAAPERKPAAAGKGRGGRKRVSGGKRKKAKVAGKKRGKR